MKTITFKGLNYRLRGKFPNVGNQAPAFKLVGKDLIDIALSDLKGKRIVLNIFPSLDTDVCAMTVRRFNQEAAKIDNATVMCVSKDLPFAASRFCVAEGLNNVVTASAFRSQTFAVDYGVEIVDGPLAGLLARAVVVIDETGQIIYAQLVDEITSEPDYAALLNILNKMRID